MPGVERKTLLLVEDEAIIALVEKRALENYGYSVLVESTGEAAVAAVKATPEIDLVLMDINLGPGIDGTQAAALIAQARDIPLLFVSSHGEREVVEKTEAITSYGYVLKSSSITVLDASIKMAFKLFASNRSTRMVKDRLAAIIGALPDMLFEVGLDGTFYDSYVAQGALPFEPFPMLQGRRVSDVLPPPAAAQILSAIAEAQEGGKSAGRHYEIMAPAGMRWFEICVSRIAGDADGPRFILVCRDFTERKKAEDALREKDLRMKSIVESSPMGIHIYQVDEQDRLVFVGANRAADSILGIDNSCLFGKTILEAFPPLKDTEVPARYLDAALHGNSWRTEQIEYADNAIRGAFEVVAFQISPRNMAAFFFDIKEMKRAEAALRASDQKFYAVFRASPYPALIIDTRNGCFADVNDAMVLNSGFSRDELLDASAVSIGLISPELEARTREILALKGSYSDLEVEIRTKSGQRRKGLASGQIIGTSEGVFLFQTIADITERKKFESDLAESEGKYRLLAEGLRDVIWTIDLESSRFTYLSPSVERLLGFSVEELFAQPASRLLRPEDNESLGRRMGERAAAFLARDPATPRYHSDEIEQLRKDGSLIWTELVTSYSFNAATGRLEVVGITHDISERKEAEARLQDSLAEKELILKEVHHRIKDNLGSVSGLLSLQAGAMKDPEVIAALRDAELRVKSLMVLYDRLYQSKEVDEHSIKDYLSSLVDEIIPNFAGANSITVEKDIDDFLLDAKGLQSLGIIVNELLTNIMKHAFRGRAEGIIRICARKGDRLVVVSVEDDGIGMPESMDFEHTGGFGLQLVGALAAQLGGRLTIDRSLGTKVTLEFEP